MTLTGNLSVDVRNLLDRESRQAEATRAADRLARSVEAPSQRRTLPDRSLQVREKLARRDRLRQHNRHSLINNDTHHNDVDDHDNIEGKAEALHQDNNGGNEGKYHDGHTEDTSRGPPSASRAVSSSSVVSRPSSAQIPSATAERSRSRAARTSSSTPTTPSLSCAVSSAPSVSSLSPPMNNTTEKGIASSSSLQRQRPLSATSSTINTTLSSTSGRPYGSVTKFALKLREKGRTKPVVAKDRVNKWEGWLFCCHRQHYRSLTPLTVMIDLVAMIRIVDTFWRASW
jgi:hypothetical protein